MVAVSSMVASSPDVALSALLNINHGDLSYCDVRAQCGNSATHVIELCLALGLLRCVCLRKNPRFVKISSHPQLNSLTS